MAREVEGHVGVYESTDGGGKQFWGFHVGDPATAVTTMNSAHAEAVRLAIETSSRVRVTYDENKGNLVMQVRIEFKYICQSARYAACEMRPGG